MNKVKGNLLDLAEAGEFDVIVQGCNCFNTMGSGIAKEIKLRYPNAAMVDAQTKSGDIRKLGNYTIGLATDKFVIVNAYTQFSTAKFVGEDVFEYAAFKVILRKLAYEFGTYRIGLPYIGMGLAGGDKNAIMATIWSFAEAVALQGGCVTLVSYEQ